MLYCYLEERDRNGPETDDDGQSVRPRAPSRAGGAWSALKVSAPHKAFVRDPPHASRAG